MAKSYFTGSLHASLYAQFRPCPPKTLLDTIIKYLRKEVSPGSQGRWGCAVDIGCGSGQSTEMLAPHFDSVTGHDVSDAQIKEANSRNKDSNITYSVSAAESLSFPSNSVDLVTASQAAHWFNRSAFYKEVDRILVKGGVVAVSGYTLPTIVDHPKATKLSTFITDMYLSSRQYWDNERAHVDDEYKDPSFIPPYPNTVRDDSHEFRKTMSVVEIQGYVSSWSGIRNYCKKHGEDEGQKLLDDFLQKMMEELNVSTAPEDTSLTVNFKYFMIMGRKPSN